MKANETPVSLKVNLIVAQFEMVTEMDLGGMRLFLKSRCVRHSRALFAVAVCYSKGKLTLVRFDTIKGEKDGNGKAVHCGVCVVRG